MKSQMNPVEVALRNVQQDVWDLIVDRLDGKEILSLAATTSYIKAMVDQPAIWKRAFMRDFRLPDPGDDIVIDWKLALARAYAKSGVTSIEDKRVGWIRLGTFYIESPEALLAEIDANTRQASPEWTANKLRAGGTNFLAQHVKPGTWIAYAQVIAGPTEPLNRMVIGLETRHVELLWEKGPNECLKYHTVTAWSSKMIDNGFQFALFDWNFMDIEAHDLCSLDNWEVLPVPKSWPGPAIEIKKCLSPHAVGLGFTIVRVAGRPTLWGELGHSPGPNAMHIRNNLSWF